VALGHFTGIGLDLMAAIEAPRHQSHMGRSGLMAIADLHLQPVAERHGRKTTISTCRAETHEVEF
jgi:hypothetical protein